MDTSVMNNEINEAVDSVLAENELLAETGTIETEGTPDEGFKFEPMNFVGNLRYMGLGMLGIFIVIGIIMTVTAVLNKFCKE